MVKDFIINLDGSNSKGLSLVEVTFVHDITKISINKDMSYNEFIYELKNQMDVSVINKDFVIKNNLLKYGYKILIFNTANITFLLSCALENKIKFCAYFKEIGEYINEMSFSGIRRKVNNASFYNICQNLYCNDEKFSEKFYCADLYGFDGNIEHNDALNLIRELIKKIEDYKINECIPIYILYHIVNLARNVNIIESNELLSLSWKNNEGENNINDVKEAYFDIVLNETNETVGNISFDYNFNKRKDGVYFGNVAYEVYPVFRNKGYASRALKLLKEVVKTNGVFDRDLYISVKESNIYSKQVALNNGGKECFSGDIPMSVRYADDERSINIYRIKI